MDHWEDMTVIEETIRVKGKEPVRIEILLTRHGPIVSDASSGPNSVAISAKWAYIEHRQPWQAAYLLTKARNITEAMEAIRTWVYPGQNFVFADTHGGIGYRCCAAVPIRRRGYGMLPKPGWTDAYEWTGYVPFDEMPYQINPEDGFLASANNKVIGNEYPYWMGNYWEPLDRIIRIRQLLQAKETLSVEDMKQIQNDVYCVLASEMTPKLIAVLGRRFNSQEAKQAAAVLSKWDFMMAKDSVAACLFETTYRQMMENIFKDELGEALYEAYVQTTVFPPRAMRGIFRKGASLWIDDVGTSQKETLEDIIAESLTQSLSKLKETIGGDMAQWKWGKIHTLTFEHIIGRKRPLARIFNIGPFPVGGGRLTVDMKQSEYKTPNQAVHGASARMIVDLSDTNRSLHVLPTGQSGHLKSAHYKDQLPLYLSGNLHPAWVNREEIEKHSREVLTLKPKPASQ
jgi:penicillin amidase